MDCAAIQSDFSVLGRFLLARQDADVASFKTQTLRNVLMTAPYFHDGSMQKLWDAVDRYNKGDGLKEPWLDDNIEPLAELLIQSIHRIGASAERRVERELLGTMKRVTGKNTLLCRLAEIALANPMGSSAKCFFPLSMSRPSPTW